MLEKGLNLFSAEYCQPCKMAKALLDKESISYNMIDIEEQLQLAQEHGVRSVPTFMVVKDGKISKTLVGSLNKTNLAELKANL